MGNSYDTPKIKQIVAIISNHKSTTDYKMIQEEFYMLFPIIYAKNMLEPGYLELQNILKEIFKNLSHSQIIHFTENLLRFLTGEIYKNKKNVSRESLGVLLLLVEGIIERDSLFFEVFEKSISKINKNKPNGENIINHVFPLNILFTTVNLLYNSQFFENQEFFPSNSSSYEEKFHSALIAKKILFSILYYRDPLVILRNKIDFNKLFLSQIEVVDVNVIRKFLKQCVTNSIGQFFNICNRIDTGGISWDFFENYVNIEFYLLIWFCFDINKFYNFNSEVKNTDICMTFFLEHIFPKDFIQNQESVQNFINEYNGLYHSLIIEELMGNIPMLKSFIHFFFSNYEKFTERFKFLIKILLVSIFELHSVR
jgi:hypothetical protein